MHFMTTDDHHWRHLYPFTSHYLDRGGLRYHYLDEGSGPPVVMVHGNPSWSFLFRDLVLALRTTHRCIVVDHIGCGLSDKPGDERYDYTLARRAEDLEALLDHLGLTRDVTMLLHDWGGMIGGVVAARRPERISRLVLMNTAAFLKPGPKKVPLRLRMAHIRNPLSEFLVRGFNLFAWGATFMTTVRRMPRDVRAGFLAPYDSWANRIATLRFVQDAPLEPHVRSYPLTQWLDEHLHVLANRPTLICWGLRDWVFDQLFLDEWQRRFPQAQVHTFAEAGHYLLEDAGPQIAPLVREFLGRTAGASASAATETPRPPEPIVNVARYLAEQAQQQPERPAVVWRRGRSAAGQALYAQWTFRELEQNSNRLAHGLTRAGITRGTRTILMVRPCPELFALVFALFKIGAVPVLVDPGMGRQRMVECLRSIQAEAFIGIPLAHALRVLHPSAFRAVRTRITVGRRWFWGGQRIASLLAEPWRPFEPAPTRAEDPAAIIFTTGSTGTPKGVLYWHRIFDAQVRMLREHLQIEPGEIDLPTFPLFSLFDPALGMTAVIPEMDPTRPAEADPEKIVEAIRDLKVTNMFGSPALLNTLGRFGEKHGTKLPSLRRMVSAGAPMPPTTLARVSQMLAGSAQVFTPYGATESLPVASIGSREILDETRHASARGEGTCVGRPLPGVTVKIIHIIEEPIPQWSDELLAPPGEIGEIVVRGPMVTPEYCTDAMATRLAKIPDGDDRWHRMGDVGRLDEQGRLWFCGRKAHRVITPNGTLFTVPCEALFNQHPRVFRSALVGVGTVPRQKPVICIELHPADDGRDQALLTRELLALARANPLTAGIETILYHAGFPVDIRHNSKIFREKLAVWATEQLG